MQVSYHKWIMQDGVRIKSKETLMSWIGFLVHNASLQGRMEPRNVQAKNLVLVGTFFIGYFLIATLDSLQSSFYPSEAKKRGASAYQVHISQL